MSVVGARCEYPLDDTLSEFDPSVLPDALMAGILRAGQRKEITDADRDIFQLLTIPASVISVGANYDTKRLDDASRPYSNHLEAAQRLGFVMMADAVADDLSKPIPTQIINGRFTASDAASAPFGWNVIGGVDVQSRKATLTEASGSMLTDLFQTFAIPQGVKSLRFTVTDVRLDSADTMGPGDAFEVALLDALQTGSRIQGMVGLGGSDGLMSIQADGRTFLAPGVTIAGLRQSGDVLDWRTPHVVTVDIQSLAVGSISTLYFDLIGLGATDTSRASIQDVELVPLVMGSWHNQALAFDVNDDGAVSPIDALQLINGLRKQNFLDPVTGALPVITEALGPPPYYDVDNNGNLEPIDVLLVINELQRRAQPVGKTDCQLAGEIPVCTKMSMRTGKFHRWMHCNYSTNYSVHGS